MSTRGTIGKTNWTIGEVSPRAQGRFDADKPIYKNGAAILENWLSTQAGGVMYRPGTYYAGQIKNPTSAYTQPPVRFEPLRYSISQAYIIEFGNQYARFWANLGQVTSMGSPVEIVTPFLQADLFALQTANKADVMYVSHGTYFPQKLIRLTANSFTIANTPFVRGPFLSTNIQAALTITPSSATGATTLTVTVPAWATATQYLPGYYVTNSGNTYVCNIANTSAAAFATDLAAGYWTLQTVFQAGHVGSLWRVSTGVVLITSFSSGVSASGVVQNEPNGSAGALGTTSATADWQEGAFSTVRGFPTACVFHEQRLIYALGQTLYASAVGSYDNFAVDSATDSDAWTYQISSDTSLSIRWLASEVSLKIGTDGGTVTAADQGSAGITPSAPPQITIDTDYSVKKCAPERIGGYLFYVQGNSFSLRQLVFDLIQNRDKSDDMTLLADHVLRDGGGATQIARQQSPCDRIWAVRADGQMGVFTRNAEQQVLSWSRVVPGYTSAGPGVVETVAIIPQDNADDVIWVVVKRIINGVTTRFVEYFTPELFTYDWDPIRLDASLSIDNPITITGITNAKPGVITAPAHGLSNSNQIKIDNITSYNVQTYTGQVVYGLVGLNTNVYLVANVTTNTFTLTDTAGNAIDTTLMGTYIGGGQVRLMNTVFSGLSYLNGETVSVMADGALPAAQQTFVVSNGLITLINPAAVVKIGLPYVGTLQFLPLGSDTQQVSYTKERKPFQINMKVWRSLGGQFGKTIDNLTNIIMPNQISNLPSYHSPAAYTGDIIDVPYESSIDTNWQPVLVQNQPLPFMLLAAVIRSEIFDEG